MTNEEIRAMSDEDLAASIDDSRQELFNLRFQKAVGQLTDTGRVRVVKREVARMKTAQRQRQLWAEYEAYQREIAGEEGDDA